jgi:signal transduction histidine kinase
MSMTARGDDGAPTLEYLRDYPVLYVDDEEPNRVVFAATFGDEFDVLCAGSADEALRIIGESGVAVMLADQRMPVRTGIELCEAVRERFPTVLRLLVTAYSDQSTAIEAINRGGVMRYLTKPWSLEEVRLVLREAVERAHLESTVRLLRTAIIERERVGTLAAMRARVLHDLANLDMVVAEACASLEFLTEPLRRALSGELYTEVEAAVSKLRTAVEHITNLHRRRAQTAQLVPGSRRLHRLTELLETVRELVRGEISGSARLTIDCAEHLHVFADRTDVSRILMNLITNARQAIDDAGVRRGEIRVAAAHRDHRIEIEVTDNGPGVSADVARRIFEPAFTTRGESGGWGLGLAICRELAQANDGTVELLPPAPGGGGARFRVTIPAQVAEPAPPGAS